MQLLACWVFQRTVLQGWGLLCCGFESILHHSPGRTSVSPPLATFTCPPFLCVCACNGPLWPLLIETSVLVHMRRSVLSTYRLALRLSPPHLTQTLGCVVLSWLPMAPLAVGPTQDYIEGNGIVGSPNLYQLMM